MIETKRRGISTFIATLLLMVLAVSAGVVIYAYTMGYLGSFGGPQTMGAISVDTWALNATTSSGLQAYIRNIGKTQFILDTVYINGVRLTGVDTITIDETGVQLLDIPYAKNTVMTDGDYQWNGSTTYEVKIIGRDNTQLSFQVKK